MKDEITSIRDVVIQVLNSNRIDYPVEFGMLAQRGCPNDACEDFLEEVIKQMIDYCAVGVNGGFNKDLKDALEVLAKVCVQLTDMRKAKDAFKTLDKAERMLAEIRQDTKLPTVAQTEIKDLVFKYIDTSLQAIPGLVKRSPAQAEILAQSEKKLRTLRAAVEKALDNSTPDALKKAEEIVAHIQKWRDAARTSNCTTRSLEELDEATNVAQEWNKLVKPVDARKRVTQELTYASDDIDIIANSSEYGENLSNLVARVQAVRDSLDERYDTREYSAELAEHRARLAELKRQEQETKERFNLNEIDMYEAGDTFDAIDEEVADINAEISTLNSEIASTGSAKRALAAAIGKVDKICKFLARYERDPAMYSVLCSQMDFEGLDAILTGLADPQAIESLVEGFRTKVAANAETTKLKNELDRSLREVNAEVDQMQREEREKNRNADGLTAEEARRKEYEEKLRRRGMLGGTSDSGTDSIDERVRRKIGSADDDI